MKLSGSIFHHTAIAILIASFAFLLRSAQGAVITSDSFAPRVDFESQRDPGRPALADFDGHGRLDVAVPVYQSHLLTIRQNISLVGVGGVPVLNSPLLGPRIDLPAGPNPAHVAVADLDGDGKPDIVVANDYGGDISIYRNISTMPGTLNADSFAPPVHFRADNHPISTVIGDFDGDGQPDLAVANAVHGQSTVSVFKNLSQPGIIDQTSFAAEVRFPVGNYAFNIAAGDLDGDGKLDLVTANIETYNISVLRLHTTMVLPSFAIPVRPAPSTSIPSDRNLNFRCPVRTPTKSLSPTSIMTDARTLALLLSRRRLFPSSKTSVPKPRSSSVHASPSRATRVVSRSATSIAMAESMLSPPRTLIFPFIST